MPYALHDPIRRTKIVATLGPASDEPGVLDAMVKAGVDVVRLNFSHGSADDHRQRAEAVREAAARHHRNVAILGDLQGPKIRIARFKWLAAYMADRATVSSMRVKPSFMRCLDSCAARSRSAPRHRRFIASMVSTGNLPAAVSADSMTASVPSSTALATSNTSARVGNGDSIIDSIICVAVMTERLSWRARAIMRF